MDEFRLRELKDLRDKIIKRHFILIFISSIISIITTIYNQAHCIYKAIRSVQNQSLKNIDLSGFKNATNINSIYYMFYNCINLEEINANRWKEILYSSSPDDIETNKFLKKANPNSVSVKRKCLSVPKLIRP